MPYSHTTRYPAFSASLHWWALTEQPAELARQCAALGITAECSARAMSRQRELLAERLLLHRITGRYSPVTHNADRAPSVEGLDAHVSIAHSRQWLCIAVSSNPIGIDIESHGRHLAAVRQGFLNDAEQQWIAETDAMPLLVAWTAKEAMFKAVSVRQGLHYRDHLRLDPFELPATEAEFEISHRGHCHGMDFGLLSSISPQLVLTIAQACNGGGAATTTEQHQNSIIT